MSVDVRVAASSIVDYDSDGYDYQRYWRDRRYEERAEAAVLRRLMPRLGRSGWFADFGGAYGRNTVHYRERVRRAAIIDYSTTNLTHAAERHAADIAAGRMYLVRADLGALPFVDGAFESAMVIRVLHHLSTLEAALPEMARTVTGRWLLDIPIKHHALGRLRAMARRQWRAMAGPVPHRTGTSDHPFWTFQLRAVRRQLADLGFSTRLAASVNNFRRWDRRLPRPAVTVLTPVALAAESLVQRLGAGWWGPNQFVLAVRRLATETELAPIPPDLPPPLAELAHRTRCPVCRVPLRWTPARAVMPHLLPCLPPPRLLLGLHHLTQPGRPREEPRGTDECRAPHGARRSSGGPRGSTDQTAARSRMLAVLWSSLTHQKYRVSAVTSPVSSP